MQPTAYSKKGATEGAPVNPRTIAGGGDSLLALAFPAFLQQVGTHGSQIHKASFRQAGLSPLGNRCRRYLEKLSGPCGASKLVDVIAVRMLCIRVSHALF